MIIERPSSLKDSTIFPSGAHGAFDFRRKSPLYQFAAGVAAGDVANLNDEITKPIP